MGASFAARGGSEEIERDKREEEEELEMRAGSRSLGWIVMGCLVVASYGCGDNSPSTSPDAKDGPVADSGVDRGSDAHADAGPATGGADGHADSATDHAGTGGTDGATDVAIDAGPSDHGSDAAGGTDGGGSDATPPTPTCTDGIKNGTETGIDCGGKCGACGPGKPCLLGTDCQFGACESNGTCGACGVPSDCPGVESECQHRTCTAGVCGLALEPAGTVLAVQTTGDCVSRQCGADGKVTAVNDGTDLPDDKNPCTNDICTAGVPSHTNQPVDTTCGGANRCDAAGQCVGCTVAADCPGTDNACRTRTCSAAGVCGVSLVAAGTKLADPTPLDCRGQQCDGLGNIQNVNDDTDLPVDGNPCTTDECNSGTTSHQPVASGMSCGGGKVCDGATNCVQCLSASTCTGTDTDCHTRTCISGACGISNATSGTPVSTQTSKDCQQVQCDGTGTTKSVADDSDLPNDGNPCTKDLCTSGVPSNPNVAADQSCGTATGGAAMVCDGNGMCVGCVMPSDCPGTDTECLKRTCTAGMCGTKSVTAGTPLMAQVSGDCQSVQCDGNGASHSVDDPNDKPVDPNACTTGICSGSPMAASTSPVAEGTSCGQGGQALLCDGHGACVGCTKDIECGITTNADCQTITCNVTMGKCVVTNASAGTATTTTPAQVAGDCRTQQCDGNGGTTNAENDNDKPTDPNTCKQDLCTNGMPSTPVQAVDTACSQNGGMHCNGNANAPACVQCTKNPECAAGSPFCNAAGACVQCLVASDCGSNTGCHTFSCTSGTCSQNNINEGSLTGAQISGDCHDNVCSGGNVVSVVDNNDSNDNIPCTADSCAAGVASHMSTVGATCGTGGKCDSNNDCVGCLTAADCAGTNTDCLTITCVNNTCGVIDTPAGPVPMTDQVTGDCKLVECDGNGTIISVADSDSTDAPDDGNVCTQDTCVSGSPVHTPVSPAGTTCSGPNGVKLCDNTGTCVQCLANTDCVAPIGSDPQCYSATCNAGLCVPSFTAANTPVVGQTAGDCMENVCDGNGFIHSITDSDNADAPADTSPGDCQANGCNAGNVVPIPNDLDVPTSPNQCVNEGCMGGSITTHQVTTGTACNQNNGTYCDAAAACVPTFMAVRTGDGLNPLTSAAAAVLIEERFASDGAMITRTAPRSNPILLPSTGTSPTPLTLSGSADSDGALARSANGHFVTMGGYPVVAGTAKAASTGSTNRVIAWIDASGKVDTSTMVGTTAFAANNLRSVVSNDGNEFWASGSGSSTTQGVFFASPSGATTSVLIESASGSTRVCEIAFGQLLCDNTKGNAGIFTVGSNLPTTGTATTTSLTLGTTPDTNASYYAFIFMDLVGNDGIPDTLYVADDRTTAPGGIQKWTGSGFGSTWTMAWNSIAAAGTTGVRGLTGYSSSAGVVLIATTQITSPNPNSTISNAIIRLVDTGTTPTAANVTTLVAAPATGAVVYRGVALAPQ